MKIRYQFHNYQQDCIPTFQSFLLNLLFRIHTIYPLMFIINTIYPLRKIFAFSCRNHKLRKVREYLIMQQEQIRGSRCMIIAMVVTMIRQELMHLDLFFHVWQILEHCIVDRQSRRVPVYMLLQPVENQKMSTAIPNARFTISYSEIRCQNSEGCAI